MNSNLFRGIRRALPLLLASACAFAQAPGTADREFVIRNARIFDGARVIPRGDVWVRNGTIEAVGVHLKAPSATRVIDGSGRTLLPGLVDAHVHTNVSNGAMGNALREALIFGVTTELDMFTDYRYAARIKKEQAQGQHLDLADLRASGTEVTTPDGHGTEYEYRGQTTYFPSEKRKRWSVPDLIPI